MHPENDEEREDWNRAAMASLGRAYGDSEPESSLDMIKEPISSLAQVF